MSSAPQTKGGPSQIQGGDPHSRTETPSCAEESGVASLDVEIFEVRARHVWPMFSPHHYMTDQLHSGARGWVAALGDGTAIGFSAIMSFPHGHLRNAWRESRTVILPDFQGLGIGARLGDWVGEFVLTQLMGCYYSRTVHPRLGEYRNRSAAWMATSGNQKKVNPMSVGADSHVTHWRPIERVGYSHRYIGYPE